MSSQVMRAAEELTNSLGAWNRRLVIAVLTLIFAIFMGYLARQNLLLNAVWVMVSTFGVSMILMSFLCGLLNKLFAGKWPSDCKQASLIGVMMISFSWLVAVFSGVFYRAEFNSEKDYPSKVAATLEQYRQSYGKYPTSIGEVPNVPPLPHGMSYQAGENRYTFFYPASGFFSGYSYSSDRSSWKWIDD